MLEGCLEKCVNPNGFPSQSCIGNCSVIEVVVIITLLTFTALGLGLALRLYWRNKKEVSNGN